MLAIADRVVAAAQEAERVWLYECLPRARLHAEGAIAFASPLSEVDIGFIRDAVAMAAALIGLGRHVRPFAKRRRSLVSCREPATIAVSHIAGRGFAKQ